MFKTQPGWRLFSRTNVGSTLSLVIPKCCRSRTLCWKQFGNRMGYTSAKEIRHEGFIGRITLKFQVSGTRWMRSEEHTSELQSLAYLVCRLLLEKKKQ